MKIMKTIFSIFVLFVIFLSGCNEIAVEEVNIGSFSRAIDYAPYLIAKNQGWFDEVAREYDVTVSYTEFQSLAPINEAFASGDIDIVFEAEPPAIIGRAAGIDIRIKGIGASLTQEIIVPIDSDVKDIADLENKKIAVLAGSSSHYGVIKILEQEGIADIEIFDMIPPDARAAFETNQVDAWAVWPPWIEQQEIAGNGFTLSDSRVFIQSIVAVRGKFADENPELTDEFLEVVEESKAWIADNEEQSQRIISNELDLPIEVVELAWPKHDFQAQIGLKELSDIQAKADFLFENELIKNRVKARDLVEVK